jgi:hypothetical protein
VREYATTHAALARADPEPLPHLLRCITPSSILAAAQRHDVEREVLVGATTAASSLVLAFSRSSAAPQPEEKSSDAFW